MKFRVNDTEKMLYGSTAKLVYKKTAKVTLVL